ncbi:MAG: beta-ketoacyl synthase [Bacteroidales bacterium]|nr:beta-ketoacyl synthase [Bacteroidales bacterium]
MGKRVAKVIAHHALTPLADGSLENYRLVKEGRSAVQHHDAQEWNVGEDFMAGLIATPFASPRATNLALHSIRCALEQLSEPLPTSDTMLIISTTKGNIELINHARADVRLGAMAEQIAHELGLTRQPVVVSNACTSGVCAQVVAQRLLTAGVCRYAIVCGVEAQSRFIVSGFQSFHALSPEPCRPFSKNRIGLNVGEAAATIIYAATPAEDIQPNDWVLRAGAIRNDANHISGPSRTGEGSYRALKAVMTGAKADELAFISLHGTATPYNDEMESIAVDRAGLIDVPIGSLKGYYGHTMGAAGVLETILSMAAVDDHTVLATLGYDDELGVSHPVKVASTNRSTDKRAFLKLISGFGGSNAAIRMQKGGVQ